MVQELSQLLGWVADCNYVASICRWNSIRNRNSCARTLDTELPLVRFPTMARYSSVLRYPRFRLIRQYILGPATPSNLNTYAGFSYPGLLRPADPSDISGPSSISFRSFLPFREHWGLEHNRVVVLCWPHYLCIWVPW